MNSPASSEYPFRPGRRQVDPELKSDGVTACPSQCEPTRANRTGHIINSTFRLYLNRMNIHVFCNDGQKVLYDSYFLASLKDPWTACYHALPNIGAVDFGTKDFQRLIHKKLETLVNEIFTAERDNEFFILSDVDIQFFAPCDSVVRETMRGADMALQSEDGNRMKPNANTGFICMRPSAEVQKFWSGVELQLRDGIGKSEFTNEQATVNKMLRAASSFKWAMFPDTIWAFSNFNLRPRQHEFNGILLHHANCTEPVDGKSSLAQKIEQLDKISLLLKTRNPDASSHT
jgi:hypothetical protein